MAGELGSAFISIFPKLDKGFKNDIKKGVDEGAKGAGESSGSLIGSNLGKGIIKAIGALGVGKAIGDNIVQSFNNFKDYQQLAGGVEKIFDQMDTSTILRDAQNAYLNLNMSANDYLKTINSVGASFASTMGDQKGYEVAKQGMQAISDYATGTGKDLSLLQEKYSLITRSTASYQSIADQFSGILPATSQAFLEQAKQAGYLADSYSKLTDVPIEEYQEAVTNMLEKGVTDLGLYGNTAKETATTVEGSLLALSAQWQNFLTGLAGAGDMYELTVELINSIKTVAQNVLPVLGTIVTSLVTALPTLLEEIVIALQENAPAIMQGAMEMFNGLVDGLVNSLPNIITGLIGLVATLASTLISLAPQILGAGITLFFGIVSAIPQAIPAILGGIGNIISSAVGALGGAVGQFISAGVNIVQGIARGIASAPGAVLNAIMNICRSGLDAVKNFFGIHSPSRVMAEQGKFIALGLAKGIEDNAKYASNAIADMNNSVYGQVADVTASATVKANTSSEFGAVVAILEEINRNIPEGMTGRQFARAVKNTYA